MDGTDLSIAYGSSLGGGNSGNSGNSSGFSSGDYSSQSTYKDPGLERDSTRKVDLPLPKISSSPPENPSYKVPQNIYASQGNNFEYEDPKPKYASRASRLSFWDKIGEKKMEVLKVFLLSLVVVLGISIDHVSKHYLDNYISRAFLTETQEVLVRISYPVIIILIIWIIKASV